MPYEVKEMRITTPLCQTVKWFVSLDGRKVSIAYHTKVEAEHEANFLAMKDKIEEEERNAEIAEAEAKASDSRFVRFLRGYVEGHDMAIRDAWHKENN